MLQDFYNYIENNDYESAEKWLLQHLSNYSDNPDLYFELAKVYYRKRDFEKSETILNILTYGNESNTDYLHAMALLKVEMNKKEEAEFFYKKAIQIQPENTELNFNYGVLLAKLNRDEEAVERYNLVIKTDNNFAKAYYNISDLLLKNNKYAEAKDYLERCIAVDPNYVDAIYNLGCVYEGMRDYISAAEYYIKAVDAKNDYHDARWNGSLQLLRRGDYLKGFEFYEERLKKTELQRPDLRLPEWKGENLSGKRILVYYEQGYGDFFQFVRYLKLLKKNDNYVILEIKEEISELLTGFKYADEFINKPAGNKVSADYKVALLSLPNIYKTGINSIPGGVPYLFPSLNKLKKFDWIKNDPNLKIGFYWSGNPDPPKNRIRHTTLECFSTLFDFKNVSFYSLQVGNEAEKLSNLNNKNVFDLSEQIKDFGDSGGAISHMDLIITIDTSIAHLSGSMGKETWLLLCSAPDWRWFDSDINSLWYPTLKYFRKPIGGIWETVFIQIKNELIQKITYAYLNDDAAHLRENILKNKWSLLNKQLIGSYLEKFPYDLSVIQHLLKNSISIENYEDAAVLINQFLKLNYPELSDKFLGEIEFFKKNYPRAIEYYNKYSPYKPDDQEVNINLALSYININEFAKAKDVLSKLIDYFPRCRVGIYNLGLTCYYLFQYDDSIKYLRYLSEIFPDDNEGLNSLLHVLIETNNDNTALEFLNKNLEKLDDKGWFYYGRIYLKREKYSEAADSFKKSLAINNSNYNSTINLGYSFFLTGEYDKALSVYIEALSSFKTSELYYNTGVAYNEIGNTTEAEKYYKLAINLSPQNFTYHVAYAEMLFMQGKYLQGYDEYEWRLINPVYQGKLIRADEFDPENLTGKKILVYDEQGFGDVFQFLRYLKILKLKGAYIILQTRKELKKLLEMQDYIDELTEDYTKTDYDFTFPLVSLGKYLKFPEDFFYNEISYLSLKKQAEKVTKINDSKKIGIVWTGKKDPPHNRKRHLELKELIPVLETSNCEYYSLQHGERNQEELEILNKFNIRNPGEKLQDFEETAYWIAGMDLIITIDTVVAHLASAMGKEVWLLLSKVPDWRWGLSGVYTIWYPLINLFRQSKTGNWKDVVLSVKKQLDLYLNYPEVYYNSQIKRKLQTDDIIASHYYSTRLYEINNNSFLVYNYLGIISSKLGLTHSADDMFNKSILINPDNEEIKLNLAIHFSSSGRDEEALKIYESLINKGFTNDKLYYNYALLNHNKGNYKTAEKFYQLSIESNPESAESRFNNAILKLQEGDLPGGFAEFRWHQLIENRKYKKLSRPEWKGEDLTGKTLFIYNAQGQGDFIQFSRYISLVKKYNCRLILECPKSLVRLTQETYSVDSIVEKSDKFYEPDGYDYYIEMYSLPTVFKTDINTIPEVVKPVIKEDHFRIKTSNKLKIGVVWQGNPEHKNDKNRSINPEDLFQTLKNEKTELVSLQLNDINERDRTILMKYEVQDLSQKLTDFYATAQIINNLDLVVSIDSAVAHLSGMTGKETWVMLPYVADWRWMIERKDSPWYPAMSLIRQNFQRNWEEVMYKIRVKLEDKIRSKDD